MKEKPLLVYRWAVERRRFLSIRKAIESSYWAMREEGLSALLASANGEGDFKALEKRLGEKTQYTYKATVRDGIGIIPIAGPLFKRANLLTEVCGATSYELVLRDLHGFLEDDDVSAIVFNIDSQGGEVSGCQELSEHIYRARSRKPITAFIGGYGASAGYWIASACEKVFASDTAIIGSIGVQAVMNADKNDGEIRFVSSQSPYKNADPSTEVGASETQKVIDDLAAVFISSVARNRSITDEKVISDFGQGLVFVGNKALSRSMIDEISTFEDVMTKVQKPESTPTTEDPSPGGGGPEIKITGELLRSDYSSLVDEFMAEGASAERARILELQEICAGRGIDLKTYIVSGISTKDAALDILKNSKDRSTSALAKLEQNEKELTGLSAHSPAEEDDWSAELQTVKNAGWLNDDRI